MNYRHQFHAGNFADVMKHALLIRLVADMQRKPGGFLFLDTHAGRGAYELEPKGAARPARREPEHLDGIGRLEQAAALPELLEEYRALIRRFGAPRGTLRTYPGSPRLVKMLARPQDRLLLCERHPEEWAALRRNFSRDRKVTVQPGDGYQALRAALPPPERRALILIDPPFEAKEEGVRVLEGVREGLRRFPPGVCALWYPISPGVEVGPLLRGLARLGPAPVLVADLVVEPEGEGLRGCGLAVINPPWRLEEEIEPAMRCLGRLLARAPGASADVRWLVPEKA